MKTHRANPFRHIAQLAFAAALSPVMGLAATVTWSDTGGLTAWLTPTNWSTGNYATTGDIATFANAGTATTAGINMTTLGGVLSLQAIEVTSARTRALTIGNSTATVGTLTLTGGTVNGIADVVLRNNSNSLLTIQNNETGTGKTLNVALGDATDNKIFIDGSGGITISSNISGVGMKLTKDGSGSGILTLSGANTYTGGTTLTAGNLTLGNASAIGSGALTISGGSLDSSVANLVNSQNNAQNWNGDFSFTGTQNLDLGTGAVTMNATRTVTVTANTLTVGGIISGSAFGLTKGGNGMLKLTGGNTYTGTTTLSAGTLSVGAANNLGDAASNLIFDGGTLQITGTTLANFSGIGHTVTFNATKTVGLDVNTTAHTFTVDQVLNQTSGGFTKLGTGTVILNQSNTYTGATTLAAGTLALSGGDNRINTANTVTFAGASTLNLGSTSQSLANLNFSANVTGTVTGSGGTLTLTGASVNLGGQGNTTLDATGLTNFIYNNAVGTLSLTPATNNTTPTLKLGANATITASLFQLAASGPSGASVSTNATVFLGQATTLNADTIRVYAGSAQSGTGTLKYNSGLVAPTLTIRGSAGGTTRATTVVIGGVGLTGSSNYAGGTGLVDLTTGVTGSILDARITNLTIGSRQGLSGSAKNAIGTLQFNDGTLDVTTLKLGNNGGGATAYGTLTVNGGTVKVTTLTLAAAGSSSGTFNINTGANVYAQTINNGAGATRVINWNDGTIHNYDGSTDLTLGGTTSFALAATGLHAYDIDSGRTGTVNSIMSGASGALTKLGAGTLVLTAANTYGGNTILNNGTTRLSFSNAVGSNIVSSSSALVLAGGAMDIQGTTGTAAANTQTFAGLSGTGGTLKLTQNSATSINVTLGAITATGSINFAGSDATVGALGALNFLTTTTTTNDNGTTRLGVALWNGSDWASTSSTGGNHVVKWIGTYSDIYNGTTPGPVAIPTGTPAAEVRILEATGGYGANILGANETINSLLMSAGTTAATINMGGFTLTVGNGAGATGAVAIADIAKSLTIGTVAEDGYLTAGTSSAASILAINNQNAASTLTVNSVIANNASAGVVSLLTTGNITLNGTNTFTGSTTINGGGTLQISGAGSLGSGSYAGAITNNGTLRYSSSTNQILSGVISGFGGALIKDTGSSTLTLSGANTYSGTTVVSAGTISAGSIVVSGGSSNLGNASTAVTLGSAGAQGTLSYSGNTATYTRGFTIGGAGGGRLDVTTSGQTLTIATGNVTGSGLFTVGGAGNTTISSNLTHTGGLTKADAGTLALAGTNTYSGTTTVNGGILLVNGNQSAATGAVIVSNTGTRLMGTGTVGGATTINSGAIHSAGSTTGAVGNQSFSSDLTYANGSIFEWDINANSTASGFDTVAVTGNLNGSTGGDTSIFRVVFGTTAKAGIEDSGNAFWNTPYTTQVWNMTSLFGKNFTSGQFTSVQTYDTSGTYNVSSMGSFTISGTSLTWTAVPEPSSALAGLLLGAGLLRRRRRQS